MAKVLIDDVIAAAEVYAGIDHIIRVKEILNIEDFEKVSKEIIRVCICDTAIAVDCPPVDDSNG